MVSLNPLLILNKKKIGEYYENVACQYLTEQGLVLLAKNSQYRLGEIDLIMQDKTCLVFIEVRYRRQASFGDAAASITAAKQAKIRKAAQLWMMAKQLNVEETEFRFDAFAVTGKEYQWIMSAF